MKKFLSFLMVMVLMLSLNISIYAAPANGSITVTNATKGQTYTLYKVFDATIQLDDNGDANAVAYTITDSNQFFNYLFGTGENQYFNYDSSTGAVTKKASTVDSELVSYLTAMVKGGSYTTAKDPKVADGSGRVVFDGLEYGYYIIVSSLGAAVTINSNTPDVEVIDKNQKPGNLEKTVKNGDAWEKTNTASIGDVIQYKLTMTVTNYDEDNQIMYYQFHDTKEDAIWVDFNSIKINLYNADGTLYQTLPNGYFLDQSTQNNNDYTYLGTWTTTKDPANADWYLVFLGTDDFRITIPWMSNHKLNGAKGTYTLGFDDGAVSKFVSPLKIEIIYDAIIEATATIGGGANTNLINTANATWTSAHESGSTPSSQVETLVYGLGILKDDGTTKLNLAGAHFALYSDSACTTPINVVPADIEGVYVVDTALPTDRTIPTGAVITARSLYNFDGPGSNVTVTPVNGKIVILGLKAGTYYLKEIQAPAGYNPLSAPVEIKAGEGVASFSVFADADGKVADIQAADGTYSETIYLLTSTTVHNSKGVELPSTGGTGTMLLITIGSVIALAFAVLLITHKKMSVYTD